MSPANHLTPPLRPHQVQVPRSPKEVICHLTPYTYQHSGIPGFSQWFPLASVSPPESDIRGVSKQTAEKEALGRSAPLLPSTPNGCWGSSFSLDLTEPQIYTEGLAGGITHISPFPSLLTCSEVQGQVSGQAPPAGGPRFRTLGFNGQREDNLPMSPGSVSATHCWATLPSPLISIPTQHFCSLCPSNGYSFSPHCLGAHG